MKRFTKKTTTKTRKKLTKNQIKNLIGLAIIVIAIIRFVRPLPSNTLTDPGEEFFALQERSLPTSWELIAEHFPSERVSTRDSFYNALGNRIDPSCTSSQYGTKCNHIDGYTGASIEELDSIFATWDEAQTVQWDIDFLQDMVENYDLYPADYSFAWVLSTSHIGDVFKVMRPYTRRICTSEEELCVENFVTLFKTTQQYKTSGPGIQVMIGLAQENLLLEEIDKIRDIDSELADTIIDVLSQQEYADVDSVYKESYAAAYNTFVRGLGHVNDIINNARQYTWEIGSTRTTVATIIKYAPIPRSWIVDRAESSEMIRKVYYNMYTHELAWDTSDKDDEYLALRWAYPKVRKNFIGYGLYMWNATTYKIHDRLLEAKEKFEQLKDRN